MPSSCRLAIVSVMRWQPILRAVAAATGVAKKNQTCAPLPERERSTASRQPQSTARLHERTYVVHPRALVEVDRQKPAGLVVQHRIDAHHVLALQVGDHGGVIDGLERLSGAVTALHLRELADTGHELVRAGGGIPWLARLLADEARRVDVRTTAEELTEQLHLVGRRAGGEPRQRLGRQRPRSRIKRCELVSKRGDSGFRRDTLRFDPREVRLCLRELGDEWVRRNGRAGHSRPDLRQALSHDGNVLHGASAQEPPKTGEAKRS